MNPREPRRYEYRSCFRKNNGEADTTLRLRHLSELRQSESVGWELSAREVGPWLPIRGSSVPGLVHLRQPASQAIHAGVLIGDGTDEESLPAYSSFCGAVDRTPTSVVETPAPVTCKRCLTALPKKSPSENFPDVSALIRWHANEIARLSTSYALPIPSTPGEAAQSPTPPPSS